MPEIICSQGHVVDNGRNTCQRCNSPVIGQADVAPVLAEEVKTEDTAVELESLTKKELQAELTKLGVEFKESESKADLIAKLKESAEETAEEVEEESTEDESEEDESEEEESEDDREEELG